MLTLQIKRLTTKEVIGLTFGVSFQRHYLNGRIVKLLLRTVSSGISISRWLWLFAVFRHECRKRARLY